MLLVMFSHFILRSKLADLRISKSCVSSSPMYLYYILSNSTNQTIPKLSREVVQLDAPWISKKKKKTLYTV